MLTKIFFTLAVVVIVGLVFRHKQMPKVAATQVLESSNNEQQTGVETKTVIYAILGLIIVLSTLVFVLHWQDEHEIINIRVSDASGQQTDYQAYKKSIDGRTFTTLDDRQVTLGDSDRVEMMATE